MDYLIVSEKDHGIYDALNKGIKIIDEDYYLVLGGDDYIYPDTIEKFISSIKDQPNLVFKMEVATKFISKKKFRMAIWHAWYWFITLSCNIN